MSEKEKNKFVMDGSDVNPVDFPKKLWESLPEHIRKRFQEVGYVGGKVPDYLKKQKNKS